MHFGSYEEISYGFPDVLLTFCFICWYFNGPNIFIPLKFILSIVHAHYIDLNNVITER